MDEIISRHCFLISKANALLQFILLLQFFLVRISGQPFLYKSASPRGPNAKVYNFSSILVFISPQAFSERNIRVVQLLVIIYCAILRQERNLHVTCGGINDLCRTDHLQSNFFGNKMLITSS